MKRIVRYIVIILTIIPAWSSAFIYDIKVLRKWDKDQSRYSYFVGCSDFHDKTHPITLKQRGKIEQFLATLDKSNTKIILEDLSSINVDGRRSCGRFLVNSRGGILGGLVGKCDKLGLAVANVEFRYCRVTSLGPVLNNLKKPLTLFPSVRNTRVGQMAKEIQSEIDVINSYSDEQKLKREYGKQINKIAPQMKSLHMLQHPKDSIADYLAAHSKTETRLRLLKKLLTFDSGILDAKLVHEVVNTKDKQYLIAFAGGAHINKVSDILQKIGYRPVHSTKVSYTKEHNLRRCLGSATIAGYCIKPQPVSLDVLGSLVKQK